MANLDSNVRERAIMKAAEHLSSSIWERYLEDHADLIANYIRNGNSRGLKSDRCSLCSQPMAIHSIRIERVKIHGKNAERPAGWDCPRPTGETHV